MKFEWSRYQRTTAYTIAIAAEEPERRLFDGSITTRNTKINKYTGVIEPNELDDQVHFGFSDVVGHLSPFKYAGLENRVVEFPEDKNSPDGKGTIRWTFRQHGYRLKNESEITEELKARFGAGRYTVAFPNLDPMYEDSEQANYFLVIRDL